MYVYHNIETDDRLNVNDVFARQTIIEKIKRRFQTYGYDEITTSSFEAYDLYAKMNGTINHQEMIKTIDNTGKVLVLRPDITIPLTEQLAKNTKTVEEALRYFYVLDVFRQEVETSEERESTQAGVEFFGNPHANADAEVIALAVHLLKDIHVTNFKIELGHAGFFKQLIAELNVSDNDMNELIELIRAKNVPEIEQFVQQLSISEDVKEIITSLPFLYGQPQDVLKKALKLPLEQKLKVTLDTISDIYDILTSYGLADHVVLDLSLINHMDYYSDIIFQGFIENVGKPIIMGGRYNTLANQFGATIPAIGFACDINLVMSGVADSKLPKKRVPTVAVMFSKSEEKRALQLAMFLRNENIDVITHSEKPKDNKVHAKWKIIVEADLFLVKHNGRSYKATTKSDIVRLLNAGGEGK